jgi:hypothetical protein
MDELVARQQLAPSSSSQTCFWMDEVVARQQLAPSRTIPAD